MPSIIFVCTGNLIRSPLTAAYFQSKLIGMYDPYSWKIDSAGTWTREGVPVPASIQSLGKRWGLDLDNHASKQVNSALLSKFDLIIVMEAFHKEALVAEFPKLAGRIYLLSEMVGKKFDISDPRLSENERSQEEAIQNLFKLVDQGFERISLLAIELARHEFEP